MPAREEGSPSAPQVSARTRRRVIAASFIGNGIEWFDYGSYSYLATMIAVAFFPESHHTAGLLSSFAVFAVSFIARPFGGILWGHLGDKIGRKTALSLSILLMSAATFLVALLPTFNQVGFLAPALLLVLRLIQGFSAGGEYGGAASFLAEYAPDSQRGRHTSAVPASTATGLLLGSLLATLLTNLLSTEQMNTFGWRLPFLIALPLGLIGWYIRAKLEDTPVFKNMKHSQEVAKTPMRELMTNYRKPLVLAFGVTLLNAVGFYIVLTYMPTYLSEHTDMGDTQSFLATTVALITYVGFVFISGALSDRFGRKHMLIAASATFIILTVPLFIVIGNVGFIVIMLIQIVLGAMLTMNDGTLATYLTEIFPSRVRFSGFAFSFNMANAIFGGTAPFVATLLISVTGSKISPAWYLVGAATVTLVSMLVSAETVGRPLQHESTLADRDTAANLDAEPEAV